jgi:excisionase family DNA binding protein
MEDRTLSLSEVAGLMGVSERTIRRWIKAGKLRAYKPGRDYRIPESALRQFVEESEISPKALRRSSLELSLFNGLEEERRAKLTEVGTYINELGFRGAEYYEEELERGRATDYATANAAFNLAVQAVEYFSRINGYLFDHGPARPLWKAMEQGVGLEIEEEYDALIDALIERTKRTQSMLFANAERLAETEAQRARFAARRQEAEATLNANVGRRSA